MSLSARLRRAPLRLVTGAYLMDSGKTKLNSDDETAKSLHTMASGTYPVLSKLEPKAFTRALGIGEMAVGATLLLPIVPPFVAGAALAGFSGAQLNMYWQTPGLHHEGSVRPTAEGEPMSKHVLLFGIGLGLMTDAALDGAREGLEGMEASLAQQRTETVKQARRLTRRARRARVTDVKPVKHLARRADEASGTAANRLAEMRAEYGPMAAEKARTAGETVRQAAAEYGPIAAEKARAAGEAVRQAAAEYGPVAAEKARTAGETVRQTAAEYGPIAAEKARTAGETVRHAAAEYGPVAADKVKAAAPDAVVDYAPKAAEKARAAGEAARQAAAEYGPVAVEKMKAAGHAVQDYAKRTRERLAS
jgi:uncharacterized membrane protein YphA (DoxX/SURF4 family)